MNLNFSLLNFKNENYTIYRLNFIDANQLLELRKTHNKTNSFFRNGNFIYHSPMVNEGAYLGGETIELNILKDIDITKNIIHHLIFRKILSSNCIMSKFDSIEFFIPNKKYDLTKDSLEDSESSKVGYWKGFKVDTRIITYDGHPYYGVALNILHSWKIKINCESILEMGISIKDRFVEIYDGSKGEIFKNNRILVGKIISHDDKTAIIEKEGKEGKYLLEELYFENSFQNRQEVLETYLGSSRAKSSFKDLTNNTQERSGAKGKWSTIIELQSWLKGLSFTNEHGFVFELSNFISNADHLWKKISISKPVFYFNSLHSQTDKWHDRGLREYGPFSKTNFTPNQPKIAVIFRQDKRGQVSRFIGKFRDGIPSIQNKGYQPYGQGFASKYRLSGLDIKAYAVKDESLDSYSKAVRKLLEENGDTINLVFLESCQEYKNLSPELNPYYFTKAELLKHGIPSQVVLYENMILPDRQLVYLLNNVSLASYAKIGGIPWVTPSDPNVEHEIVIGIGSKVFKENRFSISRRIVGIATLFSGDGKYLLSNTSKDVPFEDYLEELQQSLMININKVRIDNNWIPGDTVRLVFHVFKPFSNDEINAIERMVIELKKDYEIIFAYITIAQQHPFLIFDRNQIGVKDFKNYGKLKGIWQPNRTTNLKINKLQWLLQLTGPSELKSYRQGMAAPVLIKLHEKSSFTDMEYLTQQIFYFSCISWRYFSPASFPVTLDYANQIAKLLGNLRDSGHWNSDLIPNKIKSKAWFL